MVDAIGPLPPHQPSLPSTTNVPALAKQLQSQVQALTESLQQILEDQSLSEQTTFLQKLREDISHLDHSVQQALKLR